MESRIILSRGMKIVGFFLFTILLFLLLPFILRYALESLFVTFGIQILLIFFLIGLLVVLISSVYRIQKKEPFFDTNHRIARVFNDWKRVTASLILGSWVFFILGFSITAYWLKEVNLWIGAVLIIILFYILIRVSFSRYIIGKFKKISKFHQITFFSTHLLLIFLIFPYVQVNSVLPAVSSEETMEFNSTSKLVSLESKFSLDDYVNGFPLDHPNLTKVKNIQYNNFSLLDIYFIPRENTSNPILLILHGGGWISGSKDDIPIKSVSNFFAIHGFTVFTINYRLYPEVTFLGMLHDVRDAIVFAKNNAQNYNGNKNSTFLFGRSAGAQLGLIAAYGANTTFFRETAGNYSYSELKVDGVASIYGISSMDNMASRIVGVTSDKDASLYDLASPLSYINKSGMVPTFIAAGTLDALVSVQNSRVLKEALSDTNNTFMYLEIPWANHSFDGIISSLSSQLALYFFLTFFSHFT